MGSVPLFSPDLNKMFVANYFGSSVAVIKDTTAVGVEEPRRPRTSRARQSPTIALGSTAAALHDATLYDIHGRRVVDLEPGRAARLTPGVYFVREPGHATRKVVLAK